jgi:haloacetate dehalogenase
MESGKMHTLSDVVQTWRDKAADVCGHPLPSGHFIPEEAPEELLATSVPFLQE